jgi:hypothetical protein
MPPESTLPLHFVVTDKRLLDNELAAQFMMLQALDHPQAPRNRQRSDNHTSEVFLRFENEAPDDLAVIGERTVNDMGTWDSISEPFMLVRSASFKKLFQSPFLGAF